MNYLSKNITLVCMKVKELREQHQYSQTYIAEDILNITQPSYCRKENGKTPFSIVELIKLTAAYHIHLLDFFLMKSDESAAAYLRMHDYIQRNEIQGQFIEFEDKINYLEGLIRHQESIITHLQDGLKNREETISFLRGQLQRG